MMFTLSKNCMIGESILLLKKNNFSRKWLYRIIGPIITNDNSKYKYSVTNYTEMKIRILLSVIGALWLFHLCHLIISATDWAGKGSHK